MIVPNQRKVSKRWRFLKFMVTDYTLITNLMHWLLFIHKYYSPLHLSSNKCSSSGWHSCIHAVYGTVTLWNSSCWPVDTQLEWELTVWGRLLVGRLKTPYQQPPPLQSVLTLAAYRQATRNSYREWQYHMLHVYNCILLKISTWGSKHVEEINILCGYTIVHPFLERDCSESWTTFSITFQVT
jgi:hypothetical protein